MKKLLVTFFAMLGITALVLVFLPKTPYNKRNLNQGGNSPTPTKKAEISWKLDDSLPENYVPCPGVYETYMVLDGKGNVIGYKKRVKNSDGSYTFEDIKEEESIFDGYDFEVVDAEKKLYKKTDSNGKESYYVYVQDEEGNFAYVASDKEGTYLIYNDRKEDTSENIPKDYAMEDGDGSRYTYTQTEEDKTVYEVRQGDVVIGYQKREQKKNELGQLIYTWTTVPKPEAKPTPAPTPTETPVPTVTPTPTPTTKPDGGLTQTNVVNKVVQEGNYLVTYQQTVTRVFDKDGNLLTEEISDPVEVSRTEIGGAVAPPDTSKIEGTLKKEYDRVTKDITYISLAKDLLAMINEYRRNEGLGELKQTDEVFRIAKIYAADMATTHRSDLDSMLYGTNKEFAARYQLKPFTKGTWLCPAGKKAEDIFAALIPLNTPLFTDKTLTECSVAVAQKNGYLYICEIYR